MLAGMSSFDECWKRIARAGTHATTFIAACHAFLHSEPYEVMHEMKDSSNGVLKILHAKPLDPDLTLEIGEYFYQIRAALDATIWKAHILLGGSEKASYSNRLDFPIHEIANGFDKAAFHNILLPKDLKDFVRSVQPCFANEYFDNEVSRHLRVALLTIHDRARKDRHRRLNVIGGYLSNNTVLVEVTPPAIVTYVQTVPEANMFEDGAIYGRFGLAGHDSRTKIKAYGGFTVQVAIEEVPAAPDVDVAKQLETLSTAAALVVRRFEVAFGE